MKPKARALARDVWMHVARAAPMLVARSARMLMVRALLAFTLAMRLTHDAVAAEKSETYRLQTRIVEQTGGGATYDGSLELKIAPDGVVSGYYRDDANPQFVMVSGGLTGNRIWFDLGTTSRNPMRFSGSFADGKIDASSSGRIGKHGRYAGLALIAAPVSTSPTRSADEPLPPQ